MIKYRIQYGPIPMTISLDADKVDAIATLEITADEPGVNDIAAIALEELVNARGAYGHLVGRETTPQDLAAAMAQLTEWQPQIIQGTEIISHKWQLEIPADAVY